MIVKEFEFMTIQDLSPKRRSLCIVIYYEDNYKHCYST